MNNINIINKIRSIKFLDYLIFNILFAVIWYIYTHGNVIYYWDGGFPLNPIIFISRYINVWNYPMFPGSPNFGFQQYLPLAIISLPFCIFNIPIGIIQWIITQIFANISFYGIKHLYLLLKNNDEYLYIDKIFIITVSLFYLFNYYSLLWISEYLTPIIFYFVTPTLIYFYIKIITAENKKEYLYYLLLTSIIGLFGVLYEDQTMDLFFLLFIFIMLIFAKYKYNKKISMLIFRSLIFLLVLIFSGFYLFLYLYGSTFGAFKGSFQYFGNNYVVVSSLDYSYSHYNILNTLTLYIGNVTNLNYIIKLLYGVLVFISLFIIVLSRKYITEKRKMILFYAILFVLIILFGLQSGIINLEKIININNLKESNILNIFLAGFLYAIQYQHIGYLIYFIFTLLLIIIFSMKYKNTKTKNIVSILILIFLIFNDVVYSYLLYIKFNSTYNVNSITLENTFNYPIWFKEAMNIINRAKYNNIVILPIQYALSGTIYYNLTNTTITANNPAESNFFLGEILSNAATSPLVYELLNIPSSDITNLTNYLAILGVKYIIVDTGSLPGPGTPAKPWVNLPGAYPWNFSEMIIFLNKTSDLKFVGKYGPYYIYEVNFNVPLVYASNGIPENLSPYQIFWDFSTMKIKAFNLSIINNLSAPTIYNINAKINYKIINNDEVIVDVNAKTPFYLIYDQGYNNLWVLKINGKINNQHFITNDYANAWLMPAGNYTAVIYIKTHKLQYISYFISLSIPIVLIALYLKLKKI